MPELQATKTKQQTTTQDEISEEFFLEFTKEAFRASGLTQNGIAKELGISQAVVNKALKGDPKQRLTMVRILNTWHPTYQVEPVPILRYRIKRRE